MIGPDSYEEAWSHEGLSGYDEWKTTPPAEEEDGSAVTRTAAKRKRQARSNPQRDAALRRVITLGREYHRRHGEKQMLMIQPCSDGQYIIAWAPDIVRALELLGNALEAS